MRFNSISEAIADEVLKIVAAVGASDHMVLQDPDNYYLSGDLLLVETLNDGGDATWNLYSVGSNYVGSVDGVFQYEGALRIGPIELSDSAIPGTLGTVETDPAKNVFGSGYDRSFALRFESNEGPQELSIYTDVGSGIGDYRVGDDRALVFKDDIVVIQEDVTDALGSPGNDAVNLDGVAGYRGFKGDDTILSRTAATIFGGSGDDIVQTHTGDDVLNGNQNNDQLYSGTGYDIVDGGTGDDKIILGGDGIGRGGQGSDRITIKGTGELFGGKGEDTLGGDKEAVTAYGGDGADYVSGSWRANDNTDDGDYLYGGKSDDTVSGGSEGDYLFGGTGHDLVRGWKGDDTVRGGSGNDTAFGNDGDDLVYGGDGHDSVLGGRGLDTLYGGNGNDYLNTNEDDYGANNGGTAFGGSGRDVLDGGRSADALYGGKGNDNLQGGRGDDILDGGSGNDVLDGGFNNDVLNGGDGRDIVFGGRGDDFIRGGHDDDVLTGDEGKDIFGFGDDGSTDTVTDFNIRDDQIQLVDFTDVTTLEDIFLSQDESTAVIQARETTIRLENTDVEDLDEASFLL